MSWVCASHPFVGVLLGHEEGEDGKPGPFFRQDGFDRKVLGI